MDAVKSLLPNTGVAKACKALNFPRASFYRRQRPPVAKPSRASARRLSAGERQDVLEHLHSERFVDKAPAEVYATLLDEDQYLCSERTMYRILADNQEVRERRDQLRHPAYTKPELLATAPNQVWSWDITKLKGPQKWTYFYLYVIIDIFSRYVTGWLLDNSESAASAKALITQSCGKQDVLEGQLILHSDRGPSMKSKAVAQLLGDLGVTKSHSRPYVSDDNPFSESQFKTLKYRPEFPRQFGCIEDARSFCRTFFHWYNTEHYHSGIGLLTPETVHFDQAKEIINKRKKALMEAYSKHPERFVRGMPNPPKLPEAVWINPPKEDDNTVKKIL